MTRFFNEVSKQVADAMDLDSEPEIIADLESGRLVVIERDLVEQLTTALESAKEFGCSCDMMLGYTCTFHRTSTVFDALAAAKAAGFGKER